MSLIVKINRLNNAFILCCPTQFHLFCIYRSCPCVGHLWGASMDWTCHRASWLLLAVLLLDNFPRLAPSISICVKSHARKYWLLNLTQANCLVNLLPWLPCDANSLHGFKAKVQLLMLWFVETPQHCCKFCMPKLPQLINLFSFPQARCWYHHSYWPAMGG